MTKPFQIFIFNTGIELIAQEEPIRILYVMKDGKFITNRYLTHTDFSLNEDAFFLENGYDGENIAYYNYSDEQLEMIKNRLEKIEKMPNHVPDLFNLIDKIEYDFSDRYGFRQEWECYSRDNRNWFKMGWHSEIMRDVNLEDVEDAVEKIPTIIKNTWLLYSGLKRSWETTNEETQNDIINAWKDIIRNEYSIKAM